MLLTPGRRSPCASIGDTAAPIASPVTNTMAVRIVSSSRFLFRACFRDDLEVLVVLVADVFEQFRVGCEHEREYHVPWPRVGARIVDRDSDLHVTEILAREA